jgi:hypothetical protein
MDTAAAAAAGVEMQHIHVCFTPANVGIAAVDGENACSSLKGQEYDDVMPDEQEIDGTSYVA